MNPEQQRIAALEAELAALRTEMQDFSYTVSHDLRASLRHILSYAQLVQEDAGPLLPAEALGFVHTIADSARHMGVLMDGLMELSRLGTVAVRLEPLPLQDLVNAAAAELQQQHPVRRIDWQVQSDLPLVLADAALLRAALLHGLGNAVKFTAHQELQQISVSAHIRADPTPAPAAGAHGALWVRLQIQDNGAGFNPALQAKLFKPFSRLHTTKQFPGIGMGLALTRKLLERMGGQAQAVGVVDGGCTLSLVLPAALPGS